MKRKATVQPSDPSTLQQRAARQTPVSCLNCRVKKLKCDRGDPCSSCAMRGVACTGLSGRRPASAVSADAEVLTRLDRLETAISRLDSLESAVFGGMRRTAGTSGSTPLTAVTTPSQTTHDTERQQTAHFLDSTFTRDDHSISNHVEHWRFHVAPASSHPALTVDSLASRRNDQIGTVALMTRDEALLLLQDFVGNPYHMLPIIYEPSARALINTFYSDLEQGRASGNPACVALILSIASTSASFFAQNNTEHDIFATTEAAAQASVTWRETALAMLDGTHGSLEECQARTILAYVVYNTEGCSARFRFLHSVSVAVARDVSLHLLDARSQGDGEKDLPTREIKRRLWWHLASTDWLLGSMGSPLDGTYTVQPRHFHVRRPRNLNDNDLIQPDDSLTYPLNVPTQMSCFLQRIRLSEIIRESIDARVSVDAEVADLNTVTRLDRLFEQALAEMPPFMHVQAPIPPGAPLYLAQQRDLILLCFHIRRARLHRPFLLQDTDDPIYEPSRRQCILSARTVLSISTEMLEGSSAGDQSQRFRQPSAYRTGLIISGIFLACTILALYAGLAGTGQHDGPFVDNTEMLAEITRACRALVKAGEKSIFAANLVRNLMDVLRKYRVKGIDSLVGSGAQDSIGNSSVQSPNRSGNYESTLGSNQPDLTGEMNLAENAEFWNGFFVTMPEMDGYEQLFAGLDSFCGPT